MTLVSKKWEGSSDRSDEGLTIVQVAYHSLLERRDAEEQLIPHVTYNSLSFPHYPFSLEDTLKRMQGDGNKK